jgi:hypothetical protein
MIESDIPVSWILARLAVEEMKWEDSKKSIAFHRDRIWALRWVLEEWEHQCIESEKDRLGMGEN